MFIEDWNAEEESQEILGTTGKFGLGVQNESGQRLTEFCQENILVIANTLFPTTQEKTLESPLNSKEIKSVNPKGNEP